MFLHSVQVQEVAVGADGVQVTDLGVNPLSVVLVHLKPLNDTGTITEFADYLEVAAAMNRVSVLHNGVAIASLRGEDAAALAYFRHGCVPTSQGEVDTNNYRRSVVVPLFMGKHAYDVSSCFPAARRGEMQLEIDFDIAATGYDGMRYAVETIELPGAKPSAFERVASISATFAATGIAHVELPVGNVIRGILCWGTSAFSGAAPTPTFGRFSTKVDGAQVGYASTDWEVVHMLHTLWGRQPPVRDDHLHRVDATAAVATEQTISGTLSAVGGGSWQNYVFLDFDPTRDDAMALNLKTAARFQLEVDVEAAEAYRVVTVESVPVGSLAG